MSQPVYSDDRELAYAFKQSTYAHMIYAFSPVLVFVKLWVLASTAVLSGSWLLLGVSHIFDTPLVFFAVWLTSFLEIYHLISLFQTHCVP